MIFMIFEIRPDLDLNRFFYCDFSWTWGCDFLNRHIQMRVLTGGFWNPLAGAWENLENRPKNLFFLADINLKNNPGPGKILLRFSPFYSKTCLYKPFLFKTLCTAQRPRRFFNQKRPSTCPKPWFSWFSKFRPDLGLNRSVYCDFSWTWGCNFLNRHIRMRVLTKGYWNPLAGAGEIQEKPSEKLIFPGRYKPACAR